MTDKIDPMVSEAQGILQTAEAFPVVMTDEEYDQLGQFLTTVVNPLRRKATAFMEPIESDHKALGRTILKQKRSVLDPLNAAVKVTKEMMARWLTTKDENQRKLEAAATEAAEREVAISGMEHAYASPALIVAPQVTKPKSEGVQARESWAPAWLDRDEVERVKKLKPEFLKVDEAKVNRVVKALGKDAVVTVSLDPENPAIAVEKQHTIAAGAR